MLIDSKSNLARLMATENILIEQKKTQTAYFDIKNRILTIPILNGNLSPELYDLLLGHEVGHALETPAEGWHDSIVDLKVDRTILNVCEDARIEKKIKRKFPGIRISFVKGYKELMEMDFFGVKDQNLNDLNFIDRVNLYTKGGAAQGIAFLAEEKVLLEEVENAETFQETVKVAIKIQDFMKKQLQSNPQSYSNMMDFGDDEDGFEESEDPFFGDEGKFDEAFGDTETVLKKKTEGQSKDEPSKKEVETLGRNASSGSSTNRIQANTDRKFREKEKELYSKENKGVVYANIPKIDTNATIYSYQELLTYIENHHNNWPYLKKMAQEMVQDYTKLKNESTKVVSYLVKEFELRKNASQLSRAKVSKTGELNLTKLHEYQFTDDIFKRMTTVPNGKSHGLVMFVDWSGSMHSYLGATFKQLLNLTWFCKKINIPFEVYAFTSHRNEDKKLIGDVCSEPKIGDISITPFSLLNLLSSRMKTKEFTEMSSYLLRFAVSGQADYMPHILNLSGTPLNEAIISAFEVVEQFKQKTKAEIVNTVFLTDGEGCRLYGYLTDQKDIETNAYTQFKGWFNRNIFRDTVTKACSEIEEHKYNESQAQTIALLKLLKARVGGNVIGFYIANSRDARSALSSYMNEGTTIEKHVQSLRRNKFTFVQNSGYDEYYFLRSDGLDTDDDAEIEVKNTTTRGLVNAFSKYTTNRVANRLVLNRFINLIS